MKMTREEFKIAMGQISATIGGGGNKRFIRLGLPVIRQLSDASIGNMLSQGNNGKGYPERKVFFDSFSGDAYPSPNKACVVSSNAI